MYNQNPQDRESWGSYFTRIIKECWHLAGLAPLLGQEDLPSQSQRLSKFSNASFSLTKLCPWNEIPSGFFSAPKQKIMTENVIPNPKYWR